MNRRDFLKVAAGLVAALPIARALPEATSPDMVVVKTAIWNGIVPPLPAPCSMISRGQDGSLYVFGQFIMDTGYQDRHGGTLLIPHCRELTFPTETEARAAAEQTAAAQDGEVVAHDHFFSVIAEGHVLLTARWVKG